MAGGTFKRQDSALSRQLEVNSVTDEAGTIHNLVRVLGDGGQGAVWLTRNDRRVVKLLPRKGRVEDLRRHLAYLKQLSLDGLHVARPLALLRPPALGYVSEFL